MTCILTIKDIILSYPTSVFTPRDSLWKNAGLADLLAATSSGHGGAMLVTHDSALLYTKHWS